MPEIGKETHLLFEYKPPDDSTSLYTAQSARPQDEAGLTVFSQATGKVTADDVIEL